MNTVVEQWTSATTKGPGACVYARIMVSDKSTDALVTSMLVTSVLVTPVLVTLVLVTPTYICQLDVLVTFVSLEVCAVVSIVSLIRMSLPLLACTLVTLLSLVYVRTYLSSWYAFGFTGLVHTYVACLVQYIGLLCHVCVILCHHCDCYKVNST